MATTYVNVYATLTQFKNWIVAAGASASTSTTDDTVMEQMLEASSRYIDDKTGRTFYPRIETRYFSPSDDAVLEFDDDLLALTTLTNGDTTVISSTYYDLVPKNYYPKYGVRLKDSSSYVWEGESDGDNYGAISVLGYWGCHDQYSQRGWATGSTLAEDIDLTETAMDMTSGSLFSDGQIIKIDSELMNVSAVATNTVTVLSRGDNGSTAATHASGATVYIWRPMKMIQEACIEIAVQMYHRRYGQNTSGAALVTGAGVVVTPRDITELASRAIAHWQKVR
jgi:hypothetical protein